LKATQHELEIHGTVASGFEVVREAFAENFRERREVGAALHVTIEGEPVVDLWGGVADVRGQERPWERDTATVVWSTTKGLVALCYLLLEDRGQLDLDLPVAHYWREFGRGNKAGITVRTLLNHRAGLVYLPSKLRVEDLADPDAVSVLLEAATPIWEPGSDQGYHAISWGAFVGELFRRVAGESVGTFLRRELAEPTGAKLGLGVPLDDPLRAHVVDIIPNRKREFLRHALPEALFGKSAETYTYRGVVGRPYSAVGRAFRSGPSLGRRQFQAMNDPAITALELPWCGALASAVSLAKIYTPFALGGEHGGRRYCKEESLAGPMARQSWSERDLVIHKPIGWSQGFLKDELHLISPKVEAFGHAGMGGSLGFCDPSEKLAFGYVMNRMDWRIRSPRMVALCRAVYRALGVVSE